MADFIFGDVNKDLDGDEISYQSFLKKINGMQGDLEHVNLYGQEGFDTNPLFEVTESFFSGDNMMGTVRFNSIHEQFPLVWNMCEQGEFGISLEYSKNSKQIVGISGAIKPRNERAKIINAYKIGE